MTSLQNSVVNTYNVVTDARMEPTEELERSIQQLLLAQGQIDRLQKEIAQRQESESLIAQLNIVTHELVTLKNR